MRLHKHYVRSVLSSLILASIAITCGRDTDIDAGSAVVVPPTTANIFGKIRNDDGKPANGAVVRLTSMDFNPYIASAAAVVDSTMTDNNGTYAFTLSSRGFFNLSAEGGGKYCFRDSIYGSDGNRVDVDDDTLKPAGSISGVARLQSGDDNRTIVILVQGTNTYTRPGDTSGVFSIPVIAEGAYRLWILTQQKDYVLIDTVVTVESGENTAIPGIIRLPFEGVPRIERVVARLDTRTMHVTLSWPRCDTANIASFYIFRNTGVGGEPHAVVKNTDTSFVDDVIMINPDSSRYRDTVRYIVAACGKDLTIGMVDSAPDLLLRNDFAVAVDTVSLSALGTGQFRDFAVDNKHNFFISQECMITKLDSTGAVVASYSNRQLCYAFSIVTDENGNLFACYRDSLHLAKFSDDLKRMQRPAQSAGPYSFGNMSLMRNDKGIIYISYTGGDPSTYVVGYDSTLNVVCQTPFPGLYNYHASAIIDDTLFGMESASPLSQVYPHTVRAYDVHGNEVKTWNDSVTIAANSPRNVSTGLLDVEPDGKRWYIRFSGSVNYCVFLLISKDGSLLGRCLLRGNRFKIDAMHRIYCYNEDLRLLYVYAINE